MEPPQVRLPERGTSDPPQVQIVRGREVGAFVIISFVSPHISHTHKIPRILAISAHTQLTSTVQTYEQQCITASANVAKRASGPGRQPTPQRDRLKFT